MEWCFIVPIKKAVNKINLGGKGSTERKMKFYSLNIEQMKSVNPVVVPGKPLFDPEECHSLSPAGQVPLP